MERFELYKFLRNPSLADCISRRSQNLIAERREKHREFFNIIRGNVVDTPEKKTIPVEKNKKSRAEMLKDWKAQKTKKIQENMKQQKPIFKVGVVHRTATGSPKLVHTSTKKNLCTSHTKGISKLTLSNNNIKTGMVTRSMSKKVDVAKQPAKLKTFQESKQTGKIKATFTNKFSKIEIGQKKPIDTHIFKVPKSLSNGATLTTPFSPKVTKRNQKTKFDQEKITQVSPANTVSKSVVPNEKLKEILDKKTDEKTNKIEAEEKVIDVFAQMPEEKPKEVAEKIKAQKFLSPKQNLEDDFVPIHYSPFVTLRQKKASRTSKRSLSLNVDELIEKEEKIFRCRLFSFRKYIDSETKRLLETCLKWENIYEEFKEVPQDIEGDINSIVGKTKLLTSDKFIQFKNLIDKCESGDPLIKVDDLQGFQDWVSIEVERIDDEFLKLEKRKCNNWQEENAMDKRVIEKVKPVFKSAPKRLVGKSNIRAHIQAARKMLKECNTHVSPTKRTSILKDINEIKTTPCKNENLLKEVLTSEQKKKVRASMGTPISSPRLRERQNRGLEILVASQKRKMSTPLKNTTNCVEITAIISEGPTPTKSILKKPTSCLRRSTRRHITFRQDKENIYYS